MELAMIQDEIFPLSELGPSYLDRGTFFGDGVYEVLRSYNGKIFAFNDHFVRFERSLREIEIFGVDIESIKSKVRRAFDEAKLPNCAIYFHVTRGSGRRSHCWAEDIEHNFFLTITELNQPEPLKQTGVKVCCEVDLRWKRCDIKSLNLLPNVMAKQRAFKKGCFEAILVDSRGDITEGAGSSFFAIKDGALITRPLGHEILPSVTRKHIIDLARRNGVEVCEKVITPEQAMDVDELFLGVTTKDVLGIIEFEGKKISGGEPGPITRKLERAFADMVCEV